MAEITWRPEDARPVEADEIESEIRRVAPGAVVRLTRGDDGYRVRALLPAAMCSRGASALERDVSGKVQDVLADFNLPVER